MTTLSDKLYHLGFTDADFDLQDDSLGAGPYISAWRSNLPQPNVARLDAVIDAQGQEAGRLQRFNLAISDDKKLAMMITWIASKHGLTYNQALAEIKVIWEAL